MPDDLLAEAERIRTRSGRTAEVVGLLADRLTDEASLCDCGDGLSSLQGAKCGNCITVAVTALEAERDRLREANADLELDNEGLSRHIALMERHRMGEQRALALLRDVAGSGVEHDDAGIGWVSVQIDRPTWEALRRLVGSPVDNREALYDTLTKIVGDIGPIDDESSRRTAAHMLHHHLGGWVGQPDEPTEADPPRYGIPLFAMLDLWLALGGEPDAFDRLSAEDRRTPADTWSQLLALVRDIPWGVLVDGDTNPPPGPEIEALLTKRAAEADPYDRAGAVGVVAAFLANTDLIPTGDGWEQQCEDVAAEIIEELRAAGALVGGRSAAPTRDEVAEVIEKVLREATAWHRDAVPSDTHEAVTWSARDEMVHDLIQDDTLTDAVVALLSRSAAEPPAEIDGREDRAHAVIARFFASELAGEPTEPNDTHRDVASDLLSELRAAGLVYEASAAEPPEDPIAGLVRLPPPYRKVLAEVVTEAPITGEGISVVHCVVDCAPGTWVGVLTTDGGVAAEPPEDDEAQRRAAVAESIYQRYADGYHPVWHEVIEPPTWNSHVPGRDDTEPMTPEQVAWLQGEPLPGGVAAEPNEETTDGP